LKENWDFIYVDKPTRRCWCGTLQVVRTSLAHEDHNLKGIYSFEQQKKPKPQFLKIKKTNKILIGSTSS